MIGYGPSVTLTKQQSAPTLGQELKTAGARLALPFLGVGVLVVLLGLFLTKVLDTTDVADTDVSLVGWMEDHRTDALVEFSKWGTLLGETPTIVALTALSAGILRLVLHRWREPLLLVLCVSGQALIFLVTTLLIDRARPRVVRLDDSPPTSSFPSGHTAATTAFYVGLALIIAWHTRERWLSRLIIAIGLLFPLTMAFCRMYRGMHYLTDVATSIALSLALLTIAFTLMPLGEGRPRSARARR
jgi:membrane-associated phospholipid phosphatase